MIWSYNITPFMAIADVNDLGAGVGAPGAFPRFPPPLVSWLRAGRCESVVFFWKTSLARVVNGALEVGGEIIDKWGFRGFYEWKKVFK